jgi:hypothetical protein
MPFPKQVTVVQDEDEPEILLVVDNTEDVIEGTECGIYELKKVILKKSRKKKNEIPDLKEEDDAD